ncbi:N(2)-fixation sustaining protein CowN [Rhabdochromatium marinum]|uniref:N(2)-fixation sustaining protein CowN n=1 Tax=Rhabdochromatium marinum TaxID=48729 RepID=UPI001903624F|nr:N(2)-fixation sustaining protein CowN [Rhabdochromatium marinum]MBK1649589.1 N(2)-fixation sustaining protein CowN [Rhabdochromatium marinum]
MTAETQTLDRYISFAGIDCDQRAQQLVARVRQHMASLAEGSQWRDYFATKLAEAERRGHDELYFVGSQVNALRELFALFEDDEWGHELLEALEEECC